MSAHEYQSGLVIHRKRSPDWLISNALTPNRAWGSRATAVGRCGHDVTGIGKPDSRAVGSEIGGRQAALGVDVPHWQQAWSPSLKHS